LCKEYIIRQTDLLGVYYFIQQLSSLLHSVSSDGRLSSTRHFSNLLQLGCDHFTSVSHISRIYHFCPLHSSPIPN